MHNFQIKTYSETQAIPAPHFFILSRGRNAGKPLEASCPNCFVVLTQTEEAKNFYYWLVYGLWQAQAFHPLQLGFVIPLLRIGDTKRLLLDSRERVMRKRAEYLKSLALLQDFEKKAKVLAKQQELINQVKKAIMFKVLG